MNKNIDSIIETETRLAEYQGEDRVIPSPELKELLDKERPTNFIYSTGLEKLDNIMGGVEAGELLVVTGPTSGGKTTLLQTITRKVAKDIPTAWFTLEVTQRQLLQKFGKELPLFFTPRQNTENSIQWLVERIIEAKVKYDVKMVFIDDLHHIMMTDHFKGNNMSLEIGEIVAELKSLAVQYNLVIWLVAHNKDVEASSNREPRMQDVRDSGMIIRLADFVLGVWRIPEDFTGEEKRIEVVTGGTKAKVIVWKNRRTGQLGQYVANCTDGMLIEIPQSEIEELKKYKSQEKHEKRGNKKAYKDEDDDWAARAGF